MEKLIIENIQLKKHEINLLSDNRLVNYPVVYILRNDKNAYIGESIAVKKRMKQHLDNKQRASLTKLTIIGHNLFNRSATYNIETKLINYFLADQRYQLQNISQTVNNQTHNYYQKEIYDQQLFKDIWQSLRDKKIVNDPLEVLENKDIFKLSPFKELSPEQVELKETIIDFCKKKYNQSYQTTKQKPVIFFIKGEAGVGKSVVLSSTFNAIQNLSVDKSSPLYGTSNYLLVNHSEMLKTYKSIAKSLPNLKAKNFEKPTPFINGLDKNAENADIVFVDEAHLLLTKDDNYNNFKFDNQLEEIIKRSKVAIVVYDEKQVLKMKSYWDDSVLNNLRNKFTFEDFELKEQFRMQASDSVINWIDSFVNKQLKPLPQDDDYNITVMPTLKDLHQVIKKMNKKHGLSRVVSTFDYLHKKDGADYFIHDDSHKLIWNGSYKNTWAEEKDTINEAGSIYTIQGFDLNYVGVNLGPSVKLNMQTKELWIDPSEYKDTEAYRVNKLIPENRIEKVKETIILNSINILMKRGVKGLFIHASDPELNKYLLKLQGVEK